MDNLGHLDIQQVIVTTDGDTASLCLH